MKLSAATAALQSTLLWLAALALCVRADLPLHCLIQDVVGDWDFYGGPTVGRAVPDCGHGRPNSVERMGRLVPEDVVPISTGKYRVRLSGEPTEVRGRRGLAAENLRTGERGLWTTVYDEGLEVRFENATFMAHFQFRALPGMSLEEASGNWEDIGKFVGTRSEKGRLPPQGKVIECMCNLTSSGWYSLVGGRKGWEEGCFYGRRRPDPEPRPANITVNGTDPTGQAGPASLILEQADGRYLKLHRSLFGGGRVPLPGEKAWKAELPDIVRVTAQVSGDTWKLTPTELHRALFAGPATRKRRVPATVAKRASRSGLAQRLARIGRAVTPSPPEGSLAEHRSKTASSGRGMPSTREGSGRFGDSASDPWIRSSDRASDQVDSLKKPKFNPGQYVGSPAVAHHTEQAGPPILGRPVFGDWARREQGPIPANFDWREQLEEISPPGVDDLGDEFDQGPCGSCYAFAATLAFQMRLRIALFRDLGALSDVRLSWRGPTKCAPWTEGCNGGFSFLTFKHFKESGAPAFGESCGDEGALTEDELATSCESIPRCYTKNPLFYAKDYGYVGGYSQAADEQSIMREIYDHGPVILGFAVSAVPQFWFGNSDKTITRFRKSRVQAEPKPNEKIQPWIYATHAVVAVGWGEEFKRNGTNGSETVKFWVIRNSWGKEWGDEGYVKMRKGRNDAGLEVEAEWATPDLDRLPEGFLEANFAKFGHGWGAGKSHAAGPSPARGHTAPSPAQAPGLDKGMDPVAKASSNAMPPAPAVKPAF